MNNIHCDQNIKTSMFLQFEGNIKLIVRKYVEKLCWYLIFLTVFPVWPYEYK